MEIMTKEEYVIAIMKKLLNAYIELDEGAHRLIGDDKYSKDNTLIDICSVLDIAEDSDEASALVDHQNIDEAYDAYRDNAEPDHIYDVVVSVSYSGTLQVYAKTEEEAREYVNRELCCDEYEPFLADDEQQVDPWELDGYSHEYNVEEVNDTGEVYEED